MANKKQYFGIKYPFMTENTDGLFLDLNETMDDAIASQVKHVIFTPKRQRIRMPQFGTDLIRYIFEPNDDLSWTDIKEEIKSAVTKYVPRTTLTEIEIIVNPEDEHDVKVTLNYQVKKGSVVENNAVIVQL